MKVRVKVKAKDDAIEEQNQVIGKATRLIDKMLRDFDRMLDQPVEEVEFDVSLAEDSPFKKLSEEELRNKEVVDKVWKELPRFMYFAEELTVFQAEYKKILEEIANIEIKILVKSFKGTVAAIEKLPTEEKEKDDATRVKLFTDRIMKRVQKSGVTNFPNLKAVKNLKELSVILQDFIQKNDIKKP